MSLYDPNPQPLTRCTDCGVALYRNDQGELVDEDGDTCCAPDYTLRHFA